MAQDNEKIGRDVRAAAREVEAPQTVYVAIAGMYESEYVEGVYATAVAAMAANPITDRDRARWPKAGWTQAQDGEWSNGCDFDAHCAVVAFEIDGALPADAESSLSSEHDSLAAALWSAFSTWAVIDRNVRVPRWDFLREERKETFRVAARRSLADLDESMQGQG